MHMYDAHVKERCTCESKSVIKSNDYIFNVNRYLEVQRLIGQFDSCGYNTAMRVNLYLKVQRLIGNLIFDDCDRWFLRIRAIS